MARVFVSHSTKDRLVVEEKIVRFLEKHGIETWYCKEDLDPGVKWERAIMRGLETCDWFLLVMSPRSAESEPVKDEIDWALEERTQNFIPVLIEDCKAGQFHLSLRRFQHLDFRSDLQEAQSRLLRKLGVYAQQRTRIAEQEGDAGAPLQAGVCPNTQCNFRNSAGKRHCERCSTPVPLPRGTLLHGRYRIERHLATGGFAALYAATDTRQNRQVAIKDMLCADPAEFWIRLNFFRREVYFLQAFAHLFTVPRVYSHFEDGTSAQIVLELIRGQDLLRIMEAANNEPFALGRINVWGQALCDLLAHMHGQDPPTIRRDMKPDDIMLMEDQCSIKVVDYGTARDLGPLSARHKPLTRVYTEGYAPPEQVIGQPEPRSDLYSLAATFYHLATGKVPEGSATAKAIEEDLARGHYPPDQRWFYELIRINLSDNKRDRYYSAQEIKRDLILRQVTRKIDCPQCRTSNPVRWPYCSACRTALTPPSAIPCVCGAVNHMGCQYCTECGAPFEG